MHASLVVPLLLAGAPLLTTNEPKQKRDAGRPQHHDTLRVVRQHEAGTTSGDAPPGMVPIPAGSFRMGVPMADALALAAGDNVRWAPEIVSMAPDHLVVVDALFLDRFEVTSEQFERWRNALNLGGRPPPPPPGPGAPSAPSNKDHGGNPSGPSRTATAPAPADPRLPIREVDWNEARACARWLGKRLPTEEEWEFAARRGRSERAFYPWGEGWKAWDAARCASFDSATRKAGPPQLFPGGTFKDDVSVDGLVDLCGNVAEWTSSRFIAYPGFAAPNVKDRFGSHVANPQFGIELRAIRGGSSFGNAVSNNLVHRIGLEPSTRVEGVGFRCAASVLPGLDVLRDALDELATSAQGLRDAIDLTGSSLAAQIVYVGDAETGLAEGASGVAFARVKALHGLFVTVRSQALQNPVLVGVLALAQPALEPPLPAGSYVVRFRTRGRTKEQALEIERRRTHKPPPQTGGKPDRSAEESPLTGILAIPADVDSLIFENRRGEFAGFVPVHVGDSALFATRLSVERGAKGAAAESPERVERDLVKFTFDVKTDNGGLQPQFVLPLAFAPGTFDPTAR
jgi:formylglycine-generating enzyme required for sulfatase activity